MVLDEILVDKISFFVRKTNKFNRGLKLDFLRILANDSEDWLDKTVEFIAMKTRTPYEVQSQSACLYKEVCQGRVTYEGLIDLAENNEFRFFAKKNCLTFQ